MRGISALAIVVGGVCDVVLSGILGVPLVIYTVSSRGLAHIPKDQLQAAVTAAIHGAPVLYAAQLGIGFGCSALGGFIAASIAKQRRALNGILASWLCIGVGVYSLASGHSGEALPNHLVLIAITPLCYLAGAWLRVKMSGASSAAV
jgi:hypothetical protein